MTKRPLARNSPTAITATVSHFSVAQNNGPKTSARQYGKHITDQVQERHPRLENLNTRVGAERQDDEER